MFRKRQTSDKDPIRIGWEYTSDGKLQVYNHTEVIGHAEQKYTSSNLRWIGKTITGTMVVGMSLREVGERMVRLQESQ